MSPTAHPALRYGAIALAVVVALAVALVFFPWNVLRGPVAAHFSDRLHRQVTIGGDLNVRLGLPVRVVAHDVSIANVSWSDVQPMARAQAIALTYSLPSLLRLSPDRVDLVAPSVIFERNANGEVNWHFGGERSQGPPLLGAISVEHGSLRYRDAKLPGDVTLAVENSPPDANGESRLQFSGNGALRGDALQLAGTAGGFSALRHLDDPYPLAFDLSSATTKMHFDGSVVPSAPQNLQGALELRGEDLSKLYPIVPSPLPWTPPYALSGRLSHQDARWQFSQIVGKVGSSDLAGDFTVDVSGPRAATRANLNSRKLDYKDLGGFIGLPPGEPGQHAKTNEQQREAAKRAASDRGLPDKPFDLQKLRQHDVDLRFAGRSVKWGRFPLDHLALHMTLENGIVRFDPLDFGIADGRVVTQLVVDLTKPRPEAKADVDVRRVELKRIFPQLASPRGSAGRIGGRARLTATGNDVAELLASMNGEAALAMRGGEMSTLQLVLTNLDLARAAALLMRGGDEKAELRCAVAAMHATRGVLVPDLMVVDSDTELIRGAGSIDFGDEKYDVSLKAESKKPSLLALRGPIVISGTFKHPVVRPAVGQAIARVGAAVGLGLIAPPLALLPLIDLGNAPDANCAALYRDAGVGAANAKTSTPPQPRKHVDSSKDEQLARSR
jgi:AsmA family protein